MDILQGLVSEFGTTTLLLVFAAAVITSAIHGAVGVAGGFLMTAVLAQLIGVRPSVPIMSIALLISHGARALMNVRDFDLKAFLAVMVPATPLILLGSYAYSALPVALVALALGLLIVISIPIRHWAQSRKIKAGPGMLAAAGAAYGFTAGASIGSVSILSPFVLGYGLVKEAFVATMAVISLSTNGLRIVVFGNTDILDGHLAILGILVGIVMVPGNWIGRAILKRMAAMTHSRLVDFFALVGGLNFLYLAWKTW